MKHLARIFIFNLLGLWLVSNIIPGFTVESSLFAYVTSAFVLSIIITLILPLLKILFIPVNLLTFGFLAWFVNVVVLYLLTIVVSAVSVEPWTFPGITFIGFVIPKIELNYFLSLIVSALSISFVTNILHEVT